jgi:hypothetical protein
MTIRERDVLKVPILKGGVYTSELAMNHLQELYSMGTFEYLVSLYVFNVCVCMLDVSYAMYRAFHNVLHDYKHL